MTAFVVIALALICVALLWVLPALLKRNGTGVTVPEGASNLAILRDQLKELRRDLDSGIVSAQQYQQSREDLERRVLEETRDVVQPAAGVSGARGTALALALAIPLCAGLLYWQLGTPGAIVGGATAAGDHGAAPQQVAAMVTGLAARLEKSPEDGNGWALLGRSYFVMQRYADAAQAYARAAALIKNDADLLADYADALAMSQGRKIDGQVMKVVEQALTIDATQWKALAIAGSAAYDRKDYKMAVAYWEKLQQRADPASKLYRDVSDNIAEARQLGNMPSAGANQPGKTAKAETSQFGKTTKAEAGQPDKKQAALVPRATVQGKVSLNPALTGKASPSDTVFIFARAPQGPRMPLAIIRRQVKDLPFTFSLDDSHAMAPDMNLSRFPEVVIGARISRSGSATPQSGDLQGASAPVKVGAANVAIVIDTVVP